MSKLQNGISTIREAWEDAAGQEAKPTLPSGYEDDNRCLPNTAEVLTACNVSIRGGVTYADLQLIKFEDLVVNPRTLAFYIQGQTKTADLVYVLPSMITSFTMNGVSYSQDELTEHYSADLGLYIFNDFQNTRIDLVVNAQYTEEEIIYNEFTESFTYNGLNNHSIILRDSQGHPLTEARYTWTVQYKDIDLNLFVIKYTDNVPSLVGVFGFGQNAQEHNRYWYVPKGTTKSSNDFPESGCDFCLSLDKDDRGGGDLTEVLSIYPVDMTWDEIMENYDFIYSAIDYQNTGNGMVGMESKLTSIDFPAAGEFSLKSTQSIINAWLICRFGRSTGGAVSEYRTSADESVVFDSNIAEIPSTVSGIDIALQFKASGGWD